MKLVNLLSPGTRSAVFFTAFLAAPSAGAVQPLADFLAAGKTQSFDAREQKATAEQRSWEKGAAVGKLLPSFSARGVLQYNEYEVKANLGGNVLTIQPQTQLDGFLQLDVPLINVANYYRYGQAKHLQEAAEAQQELSTTDVNKQIVRAYYNFIGASALVDSAENSVKLAETNESYVRTRVEAGASTELDLARASANLEKARQELADAEFTRSIAARTLQTLTGLEAQPVDAFPKDDLSAEAPLETWLANKDTPNDKVQRALYEAQVSGENAAKSALLPVLSANAQERLTNATGFVGRSNYYTLQAVLTWNLDYSTYATAQAQSSAQQVQQIRAERSRRALDDSFYEAYRRVEAGIVKSRSARSQVAAADRASELALARYQAGALTQLDVTQSQRDAFLAHASQIQADSDLLVARANLRILGGKSPESAKESVPLVAATAPAAVSPALSPSEPATTTRPAAP